MDVKSFKREIFELARRINFDAYKDESGVVFSAMLLFLNCAKNVADTYFCKDQLHTAYKVIMAICLGVMTKYDSDEECNDTSICFVWLSFTTWERHYYNLDRVHQAVSACEVHMATCYDLHRTAACNALTVARERIYKLYVMKLLDRPTRRSCVDVSFYFAFHAMFDLSVMSDACVGTALAIAIISCVTTARGERMIVSWKHGDLSGALHILESLYVIGETAQHMFGEPFTSCKTWESRATNALCIAKAAHNVRKNTHELSCDWEK